MIEAGTPAVLFGIPIDACTMDDTIERFDELIRLGRQSRKAHQVATVNVDFLVNAIHDSEVHRLLQRTDLNLADGMPVVWASRLLGTPVPERVAGADLVTELAKASEERGWRIHLFGAGPRVADRARSLLLERHPHATISADAGPPAIEVDRFDEEIAEHINSIDPDVLCVAFGNPKQERFVATYRDAVPCPVMIGIGGSLDMLVGDRRRAPEWMRRVGAEWIFRAAQEPGRLGRRYLHDIRVFGPAIAGYWRRTRRYRIATPTPLNPLQNSTALATGASAPAPGSGPRPMTLDLHGVESLDPIQHASVIGLTRHAARRNTPVVLTSVGGSLRECFQAFGTWDLVEEYVQ